MGFQVRKEQDGYRVISAAISGEEWDVDGPFETEREAVDCVRFHRAEWDASHREAPGGLKMTPKQIIEQHIVDSLGTNAPGSFQFFTQLVNAGQNFTLPELQQFADSQRAGESPDEEGLYNWAERVCGTNLFTRDE